MDAIRTEIVAATKNFLSERLNIEQEQQVQVLVALLSPKTVSDFVRNGRELTSSLFGEEAVAEFAATAADTGAARVVHEMSVPAMDRNCEPWYKTAQGLVRSCWYLSYASPRIAWAQKGLYPTTTRSSLTIA